MKKSTFIALLFILLIGTIVSSVTIASAQKPPKLQTTSLSAPVNLKIDGETKEWGKLQAYNPINYIFYTISNDDKNLYLVAYFTDKLAIKKIFRGGLTFSVFSPQKKAQSLAVTFPAIKTRADEAKDVQVYNQIYLTGVPETTDPFIPLDNTQGIRIGAKKETGYTYELAIPIALLQATLGNIKGYKYNIKLNSNQIIESKKTQSSIPTVVVGEALGPLSGNDMFLFYNTDFTGEYTLALKP